MSRPAAAPAMVVRALPWCAAVLGMAMVAALFWPGYMSWDSAYQWWQARHNQFDATHPPLMAMLWQQSDRLLPGPGGFFLLQLGMFWLALVVFVNSLPLAPVWRATIVLVIGLWPPLLGLQVHLWKDIWMLIGFAWATAWLARDLRQPSFAARGLALLAIVFACSFRHNALSGALPLLGWLVWRQLPMLRLPIQLLATVALAGLVFLFAQLPAKDARVKPVQDVWSVVTLWDAAAVSLIEHRLVYPPSLIGPDLSLADLRTHFSDFSNTTVFVSGKLRHSLDGSFSEQQQADLRQLAWALPSQYPQAYFAHRLRLAELLFGFDPAGLPDHQVLMPGLHAYGDNPRLDVARPVAHDRLLAQFQSWVDTPLFAGWCYLLACLLVMLSAIRSNYPASGLATAVAASAWLYALPLALVSGSAEFRYLAWPVWASLAALCLRLWPGQGRR